MEYFAGLDVSLKETAICIVDETGRTVREARRHNVRRVSDGCCGSSFQVGVCHLSSTRSVQVSI